MTQYFVIKASGNTSPRIAAWVRTLFVALILGSYSCGGLASRVDGTSTEGDDTEETSSSSKAEGASSNESTSDGTSDSQSSTDDMGSGAAAGAPTNFTNKQIAHCRDYSAIQLQYWIEASLVGEYFDDNAEPPEAPCYFCSNDCGDSLNLGPTACNATNSCVARHCLCEGCQDPSDDGGDMCACIDSCMAAGESVCSRAWDEFLSCEIRACLGVCGG